MEISTLSIPRHAYRVCEPRTRLYHRIKTYLIRTTFAHDTGSAAGERGEGPAARLELSGSSCSYSCSAGLLASLLQRSGARPR